MRQYIKKIGGVIKNNKKIVENYFFMTLLQVLNSLFYLLLYPYLIRVLGGEGYGLHVFATSIATYFIFFINFGFDLPATKLIAENVANKENLRRVLSEVFTAKNYLFLISVIVFAILLISIPLFWNNKWIFISCFSVVYFYIAFPQWFFQGIQQMRVVTMVQLGIKILSLPFIFIFVREEQDLILYAFIIAGTTFLGGIVSFLIVYLHYDLRIYWVSVRKLRKVFKDSLPFFYSYLAGTLKEYSIPVIIGSFIGMHAVAVYDLANKITYVPRILFMSINTVIFPKLVVKNDVLTTRKVIIWELSVSFLVLLAFLFFGKYIVILMGGSTMTDAYAMSVVLSTTIMSRLVVGAYTNFVFIPNNSNYLITKTQLVALISFVLCGIISIIFRKTVLAIGVTIALSAICEIVYCMYVSNKRKLLSF